MSLRGAERRSNLHIWRGDTRFAKQFAARTLVLGVVSDHAGEYRCCFDTERLAMTLDKVTY
jgi:hypothetical protein